MKTCGGVEYSSIPCERAPNTHCIGVWVGSGASVDDVDKWKFLAMPGNEPRCPAHSPSLYRLSYPCLSCTNNARSKLFQISAEFHVNYTLCSSNSCLAEMCKLNIYVAKDSFLKTVAFPWERFQLTSRWVPSFYCGCWNINRRNFTKRQIIILAISYRVYAGLCLKINLLFTKSP
jgi:hypothetical protein